MAKPLPDPPAQLKAIQSYMRVAQDIERVDPVIAYWLRLYSTETALTIDRESPECKSFLGDIISYLENFKQTHKENETVSNGTVGQAHYENFVVALFNKADTLDREGTANKNTVRMFYMSAVLFEAMAVFGPLTDEVSKKAKYAKFKAAYIQKCLKAGETPKPGPIENPDLEGPASGAPNPSLSTGSDGRIDIPEVPSDSQPRDPFILTPSSPPPQAKMPPAHPSLPPMTPMAPSTPPMTKPAVKPAASASNNSYSTISDPTPPKTTGGSTILATRFHATNGAPLNAEDIIKGQKFCKFATSALQYDDIPTAVANLEKALKLLTTGQNTD